METILVEENEGNNIDQSSFHFSPFYVYFTRQDLHDDEYAHLGLKPLLELVMARFTPKEQQLFSYGATKHNKFLVEVQDGSKVLVHL
jgi:hypothetical protein